ncbi:MAG: integrase [Phycisphaeraceae bacterium]|nr:integrase [Phycisphaeraceae bacterium]
MAGLAKETRKDRTYYRITLYDRDGRRRFIRIGDVTERDAERIKDKVDSLVSASIAGTAPDQPTARWVAKIGDELADKLATAGLIEPRQRATLGGFLDDFIGQRTDLKPSTRTKLGMSRRKMVDFFGTEKDLRDIDDGGADNFRQSLVDAGLAEATIGRTIRHGRQFFKAAVRRGLAEQNPFVDVAAGNEANDARQRFIDAAIVDKAIEQAPDHEWRLIIALSRYGGVRTPSETLRLKWSDIDWEHGRFTVTSPKTARKGKPYRVTPLFPELLPYLQEAFDLAESGADYVITRYRDAACNLRTHFLRILRRAGVEPWPRLFHNMRASRQTELVNRFPSHVAAEWLGNTEAVANRHYLQVTEAHFEQAAAGGTHGGTVVAPQMAPHRAANDRTDSHKPSQASVDNTVTRCDAIDGDEVRNREMVRTGLEPVTCRV